MDFQGVERASGPAAMELEGSSKMEELVDECCPGETRLTRFDEL